MQINGKKIERIVASGCSFTYGQGLSNPEMESWPAQLANLLGAECVNLGMPGMGNEHVLSSIVDYFSENPHAKNNSLVLPCFSSYSRVEFWSRNKASAHYETVKWTTIINSRQNIGFNKNFFEQMFDEKYYYNRYLRIIISLQSILKAWEVPYLMFEGVSGNPHKNMLVHNDVRSLLNEVNREHWLRFATGNLDTMTSPSERFPDGHPNVNAYKEMADILYKHLLKKYDNI